jgi:hypothetical protein
MKKKRAALLMLKMAQSESKKALLKWSSLVRINREGTKCRRAINFFSTLAGITHDNLSALLN